MLGITFVFVALQILGSLGRAVEDPENAAALKSVANDGLEFSKQFYGVVTKAVPGNLICSPVSASSILSMLTYGARGDTETALKSALHFNNDNNIQRKGLKTLLEELNDSPGVELKLANKIFLANGIDVKPDYQQLTEDVFKSSVQKVDFTKTEEAVKTINNWCEEQTNSKIKDVVSSDNLGASTLAVLVNAAYFNGKWEEAFDKEETSDDPFHFEDGSIKNVSTMHAKKEYNYGILEDVKAKFAELPYQGGQISMFIILPDEVNGLQNLQQNFAQLNVNRLLTQSHKIELELSLPKFEIATEIDLKQPLTDLGMGDIFEDGADFSGMFNTLAKIDKAIQKAYIKVDEAGTEAAAVTAVIAVEYSLTLQSVMEFKVDRPFYYAIVKRVGDSLDSGVVLFQGHYKGDN